MTLGATNAAGIGNAALTLTITQGAPVITSATSVSGIVGTAFSYQITATNSPTSYSATGLPAGLSVNAFSGLISGTPTSAATSTVTLGATNAGGTGNAALTLTISAAAGAPVITSATPAAELPEPHSLIRSPPPTRQPAIAPQVCLQVCPSTPQTA